VAGKHGRTCSFWRAKLAERSTSSASEHFQVQASTSSAKQVVFGRSIDFGRSEAGSDTVMQGAEIHRLRTGQSSF
jgi:hypothetical protein